MSINIAFSYLQDKSNYGLVAANVNDFMRALIRVLISSSFNGNWYLFSNKLYFQITILKTKYSNGILKVS